MQDWYVFYQRGGGSDAFRSRPCPSEEAALVQARSLERQNYVLRIVKPDGSLIDRSTILAWIKNNSEWGSEPEAS
jgi:hypothetical protein